MTQLTHEQGELAAEIRRMIAASPEQCISFHDYMQACLYHPQWGYYPSERTKIGKSGDFYTSSSIGGIMGDRLATFFAEELRMAVPSGPVIVEEWGGGTGRLALQILDALASAHSDVYDRLTCRIVEKSPAHRDRIRERLAGHARRVELAAETEPLQPAPNILFSNELLDAFAVHRLKYVHGGWQEVYVTTAEDGAFVERLRPEVPQWASARLNLAQRAFGITFREGQTVELSPDAPEWLERQLRRMRDGLVLTIDYGDVVERLWTPERHYGTLMCYHRHIAHDNPYLHIGEQDLTAHVNFSDLLRAGTKAGCTEQELLTQKEFLLRAGVLSLLRDDFSGDPFSKAAVTNRAVRQLLIGDSMAEVFKVLIQRKKSGQA